MEAGDLGPFGYRVGRNSNLTQLSAIEVPYFLNSKNALANGYNHTNVRIRR